MTRYEELRDIFEQRRYFKVVCAAGNEDYEEVRRLALVYTLAGATGIDLSAHPGIVEAGVKGIDQAFSQAGALGVVIPHRPYVMVSVGLKGDPHVRKAMILKELCSACESCQEACEQSAITADYEVMAARCIGCGACSEVCLTEAVGFYTRKVDFQEILPQCLKAGAENIELHAAVPDDQAVMRDWQIVASLVPDNFISMCVDRSHLSDHHLANRIRQAKEVAGDRLIIQADGIPMSGSRNDYLTTLQAVAISEVIQRTKTPLMLVASGGTNQKTGTLAKLCEVELHGISVGTFARKLVKQELSHPDFDSDPQIVSRAVNLAKNLIDCNLSQISR